MISHCSKWITVLVWILQRIRFNRICISSRDIHKGIGLQLWRGGLTVCCLQLETQENSWYSSSLSPKASEREPWVLSSSLKAGEDWCPSSCSQAESELSSSFLCLFVLFISSSDWVRPAYIGWGKSALLCLLIQELISSGNTLTDITRNNVKPNIWIPYTLFRVTSKINHHNILSAS